MKHFHPIKRSLSLLTLLLLSLLINACAREGEVAKTEPTSSSAIASTSLTTPEPPVTTSEPPTTTSEPPTTTSEPPATTSELPATTPEPPVTTSEPPLTKPKPPVTTPEPIIVNGGILYKGDERIVAIDAGHQSKAMREKEPIGPGSEELKAKLSSGTQGVSTGLNEYELNLRVALALRDELIARGYTVVMIRESNDVTLSNAERAEIANAAGAGAFVRIHANGSENRNSRGAYTICQTSANPYNGDLRDVSYRLSEALIDGYVAETGMKRLDIWETDTMTGINWAEVPSTIIEMGFMSNAEEDEKMASADFPKSAALGMADGLDAFFEK